jgi:hypothetical protein
MTGCAERVIARRKVGEVEGAEVVHERCGGGAEQAEQANEANEANG